jgi:hypothetical protein
VALANPASTRKENTMIYHLDAGIDVQLWSPDDIREETHRDDRDLITDEHIGIRFYLTVTDAVLLIGTEQQVIDRMQQVITLIRRERAILDGTVVTDALRRWEAPR